MGIGWDGTDMKSGANCEEGNYTYIIDYQTQNMKEIKNRRDRISLKR